jgi:hypothetical protein
MTFKSTAAAVLCSLGVLGSALPASAGAVQPDILQQVNHYPGHQYDGGSDWGNPDWKKKWDNHRDCHRRPDRHWVRGYGRVLHRHVGPRCRVQILKPPHHWNRYDRDRLHCLWFGGVQVCFRD